MSCDVKLFFKLGGVINVCAMIYMSILFETGIMAKHLDLFGNIVAVKSSKSAYENPGNSYEQFVKCYYQREQGRYSREHNSEGSSRKWRAIGCMRSVSVQCMHIE